jgi:hypothetical protein
VKHGGDPSGGALSRRGILGGFAFTLLGSAACGSPPVPGPLVTDLPKSDVAQPPLLGLPPRPRRAPGGEAFFASIARATTAEREAALEEQLLAGNVPTFLRRLVPVRVPLAGREARVFVAPDYLAIGSDEDFVRVPLVVRTAARIAASAEALFPTVEIVDAVYDAAELKIGSPPMAPGLAMASSRYFVEHNRAIEANRRARAQPLGALLAGPKKDLVLTARLLARPARTPIYGWFREDGSVIQPLSLLHDHHHLDYTHGLRLVSAEAEIGGRRVPLLEHLVEQPTPGAPEGGTPAMLARAWSELVRGAGAATSSSR